MTSGKEGMGAGTGSMSHLGHIVSTLGKQGKSGSKAGSQDLKAIPSKSPQAPSLKDSKIFPKVSPARDQVFTHMNLLGTFYM